MKFKGVDRAIDKAESRPARGAWVEIEVERNNRAVDQSRPARGAWVEIQISAIKYALTPVAPRKGRVG